jgi:cytochrome P450
MSATPLSPGLPDGVDPHDEWRGLNILDPAVQVAFRENPHPFLAHLRATDPVNETPLGMWRVTRYEDCQYLLRHDTPTGVRRTDGLRFGEEQMPEAMQTGGTFMLQQDPPNHTRLRKLVSKAFTPRAISRLEPRIREIARTGMQTACERGEIDVIADLALPVPATMICEMMGVPVEDRERFTRWTADSTHLLAALTSPPDVIERGLAAVRSLADYFEALIAERRKSLTDDILSNLIRAEEAGDRLSPEELVVQSAGLLTAGFETTIGLIGNGILALLRHPDQLERLRADPGLEAPAIEECLRYEGPILLTVRVAQQDIPLGGKTIPRDAMIFVMLAAANRDAAAFDAPEVFDVGRAPNPHIAFGGGTHLCLGAHLARAEARIAIGEFVRRVGEFEIAEDQITWGASLFRVLGRLPVRFAPRASPH